jgi:hypothetical protein
MKRPVLHNQKCKNRLAFTSEFHAITTKGVTNEPTGHARTQLENTHTHTDEQCTHILYVYTVYAQYDFSHEPSNFPRATLYTSQPYQHQN